MTPLKMFEYQVSLRPIIASDLPSIREILNEKNCLFCKPGSPIDLAEKILYLLDNKAVGEALANQAHTDVQKYSWQNRAQKIIMALQKTTIAVIPPQDRDGLASTVFDGLLELKKKDKIDFVMSKSYTDPDLFLKSHIVSSDDFKKYAQTSDAIFLIKGKKFNADLAREINRPEKTILIDGTEVGGNTRYDFDVQYKIMSGGYKGSGGIDTEMLKYCKAYFRREKPYINGIKPLPFGIESKFQKYVGAPKTIDFCCVFGQDEYPRLRKYTQEILVDFCEKNNFSYHIAKTKNNDEFYKILAQSKVGISVGGGGFDTFRFWEVLGNDCLLLTERINIFPSEDKRLQYKRIYQFDNVYDVEPALQKIGDFLRTEYAKTNLEKEYEEIMSTHSSEARVMEILNALA